MIQYLFFFLLLNNYLNAQTVLEWEKNFGGSEDDRAYSIQQTTDGGYIIAGESKSNDGDVGENKGQEDYWIVKLDESGNLEWEKSYGGNLHDRARAIQQTTDGGYIVIGDSNSNSGDVGGNNGDYDGWFVKLDEQGNMEWEKNFGGPDNDYARSVQQTTDGGYIVAGFTWLHVGWTYEYYAYGYYPTEIGHYDCWILKLDESGNLQWEEKYGGSNGDYAYSILQTTDGGYVFVASSRSSDGDVGGNNGDNDYWIVKLDGVGNLVWEKNYGWDEDEWPYSIQQTTDGGFIVAGDSQSYNVVLGGNTGILKRTDIFVVKLNSTGNLQWEKNFGGSDNDKAKSICQTVDGGYIVSGKSSSSDFDVSFNNGSYDIWVIKLDVSGNLMWEENYGGSSVEDPGGILQTTDGGYIVAGKTKSIDGDVGGNNGPLYSADFWVLKLSGSENSDSCPPNLTITENTPFQNIYQAGVEIDTNGSIMVNIGQNVEYTAHRVRINQGFSAKAGSEFRVRNNGCGLHRFKEHGQ